MTSGKLFLVPSLEKNAPIFSNQEHHVSQFIHAQNEQDHIDLINDLSIDHISIMETARDQIVGHIILNTASAKEIEFKRLVIYYRSVGYGKMAIKLLKKYITNSYPECKMIWLDVYSYNKIAQKLYTSEGFFFNHRQGDLLIYHHLVNQA